jgi:hypothetical protein
LSEVKMPKLIDTAKDAQRKQRGGGEGLRRCFHDDARIESVAAGAILGADESVRAIEAAFRDGVYSPGAWEFEEIRPDAVLSWTSVRHRPPGVPKGRVSDELRYWMMTGREGLIWRVRVFRNRAAALEVLERQGPTLGI